MRDAERTLEAERARVKAAEAEAEFAAHAHEELSKLDVQPNEEETLAARRQAMMQGEKVAADIRDARDHLTGDALSCRFCFPFRADCNAARRRPRAARAEREGAG